MSRYHFNNPPFISAQPKYHDIYENDRYTLPIDARPNVYFTLFSKPTIDYISEQITKRLNGVHPLGKNIIVSNENIISVMDSHYENYKRDPQMLIIMVISYIVDYIKTEYQIEEQNRKLNIWVTNYPESSGIRQHAPIKLREKRPTNFEFHMTY